MSPASRSALPVGLRLQMLSNRVLSCCRWLTISLAALVSRCVALADAFGSRGGSQMPCQVSSSTETS